jgi:hypothetical protein
MTTTTKFQTNSQSINDKRSQALGLLIIGAFIAFEVFNFSTTDFALRDILGELKFLGLRWSTMLALAFCAIDFAGLAKLFTPESNKGMVKETWFLFAAWLLAAIMNAILTWWGVSVAFVNNLSLGATIISYQTMLRVIPVFVAVMVWLVRVLVISSLSLSANALLGTKSENKIVFKKTDQAEKKPSQSQRVYRKPMPQTPATSYSRTNYRNNNAPVHAKSESKNQQIYF